MGTAVADVRVNLLFTERSLICSKLKTDLAEILWLQAQHSRQCRPPHGQGRLGKIPSLQPSTGSTGLNGTALLKQSVTTGIVIKSKVKAVSGESSGKTGTLWRYYIAPGSFQRMRGPASLESGRLTLMRTSLAWGGATSISSITTGCWGSQATTALHLMT